MIFILRKLSYPPSGSIKLVAGLSQRMRGTRLVERWLWFLVRFIPAGAGNTFFCWFSVQFLPVYPRWRGEHIIKLTVRRFNSGLSPLARGTPTSMSAVMVRQRFIPAGAGNTIRSSVIRAPLPVYPRWRGEHNGGTPPLTTGVGLSPLARGTRLERCSRQMAERFIPAGAGNTYPLVLMFYACPVYPRWRGEHALDKKLYPWSCGLSPLARGTRMPPPP